MRLSQRVLILLFVCLPPSLWGQATWKYFDNIGNSAIMSAGNEGLWLSNFFNARELRYNGRHWLQYPVNPISTGKRMGPMQQAAQADIKAGSGDETGTSHIASDNAHDNAGATEDTHTAKHTASVESDKAGVAT